MFKWFWTIFSLGAPAVSCFGKDSVIAYSTQLFTQDAFFSDWNIIKNKNEISRFVSLEAIEQIGFFFIYLNRNLPQSCTFVSTGWTNVCNIAIQDTPRDLPSIHKCSNLSGYPTLTSLASRMVSNTISRILMKWSGYGQMDQCCTVWGEWGLDMSIYSPGGGGGEVTWVNFCWVRVSGLSEPLLHYRLFCGQI